MPGDFTTNNSTSSGDPEQIESLGAVGIDIRDTSGRRYAAAPETTSTIRIPVRTRSVTRPASIPLWLFNPSTGRWQQTGTATLQGTPTDPFYQAPVTRFGIVNVDEVIVPVFISGCVRDGNNQPVPNVRIRTTGIDNSTVGNTYTATDGTFRVAIRSGGVATLNGIETNGTSFTLTPITNTVTVGPLSTNTTLQDCITLLSTTLRIDTPVLPGGTVGAPYTAVLVASSGTPPYTWDVVSGSLPASIQLNAATGQLSGAPSTPRKFYFHHPCA